MQSKLLSSPQIEKPSSVSEITPNILDTFLDEKAAARLIKVAQRTLQAWRLKGIGPPFIRISRRCIRYRPIDIEVWASKNLKTSTSEK